MRKPVTPFPFATGTTNRFGRSSLGGGPSTANSNTRIFSPGNLAPNAPLVTRHVSTMVNLGLTSERSPGMMVQRLRNQGIPADSVMDALMPEPRHMVVDEGLSRRSYADSASPITHSKTITKP